MYDLTWQLKRNSVILVHKELHDFLVTKFEFEVSMESLDSIKNNKIGGMTFLELTSDEIKELIPFLGERKTIQRMINSYANPSQQEKVKLKLFIVAIFHLVSIRQFVNLFCISHVRR